jgi:gas vesicle protein
MDFYMSNNNSAESFVKGLLFGAVTGVVAGILLAPKSGAETREDIKKLAEELKDKAEDAYAKARREVEKKIEQVKKAGGKIDETKYKSLVSEVVDELKKDATVTKSAAQKLGEQLSADWSMVKKELAK